MTATPKRDDNVDTYDYFGEPIYTYSLKQGIEDGFLAPTECTASSQTWMRMDYRSTPACWIDWVVRPAWACMAPGI